MPPEMVDQRPGRCRWACRCVGLSVHAIILAVSIAMTL
jgi:hypothetical protein